VDVVDDGGRPKEKESAQKTRGVTRLAGVRWEVE